MKTQTKIGLLMAVLLMLAALPALAGDEATPSDSEMMAGLVGMCEGTATDRAARQEKESLYDRLGGYDKILALSTEIIRLHSINEDFRLMMTYVDGDHLAKSVADFMAAGTGGTATYTGRDMKTAHAHMKMTEGDFLSAGSDVMKAMNNLGYGEDETNEVVCILVSMKDMVIYK